MKKNFLFYSRISAIFVFVVALLTYLFTLQNSVSFWDCGEFISTSYKLEVGHPPGAPFYLLLGRFFSFFAFKTENIAFLVNSLSAISSAFTILFLYLTIVLFAENFEIYSKNKFSAIIAGIIGSLSFTFSDSFWFSAVEAEVYASSMLFTAFVVWAILMWKKEFSKTHHNNKSYANRWIILIAFSMGLSIGVHLLNLLAIPVIIAVLFSEIYGFSLKNLLKSFALSVFIIAFFMIVIIKGVVIFAEYFELLFVNILKMPFHSGLLFSVFLIFATLSLIIFYSYKKNFKLLNLISTSIIVILIGFSSYTLIIIRANANLPINENNPDNIFSLETYLNRDQYGNRPLFYGKYYYASIKRDEKGQKIKTDTYKYIKTKNSYVKIKKSMPIYEYRNEDCTIFPRMYSSNSNHVQSYKSWADVKDGEKANFFHNLSFFLKYQVGQMYFRYFMWNFAGRQNDFYANGSFENGNWISGFNFFDELMLGNQDFLIDEQKNHTSRNQYFMLPFLLGIIGLIYTFSKNKNIFTIIMLLFFFTGLAIVFYLNQTPGQARERDYAYVGSFYAFSIWIGFGALSIFESLQKSRFSKYAILTTAIISSSVPLIMAQQNWDDHNRHNNNFAYEIAYNYLSSCDENAILFTNADNDTFPLWYLQEVEGFRTDVRIINLSLLNANWYIQQLTQKINKAKSLDFQNDSLCYVEGVRDIVSVRKSNNYFRKIGVDTKKYLPLHYAVDFMKSNKNEDKVILMNGDLINYCPSRKLSLKSKNLFNNFDFPISEKEKSLINEEIEWTLRSGFLYKNNIALLEIISKNADKFPIYFAITPELSEYQNLENHLRLEGFALRFVPFKTDSFPNRISNSELLYKKITEDFKWETLKNKDAFIDYTSLRVFKIMEIDKTLINLSKVLVSEKKYKKAENILDLLCKILPENNKNYNVTMISVSQLYKEMGKLKKSKKIKKIVEYIINQKLKYYKSLKGGFLKFSEKEIQKLLNQKKQVNSI